MGFLVRIHLLVRVALIDIRIGSGSFQPRFWPTLLTVLMLPVLLLLGTWQVQRLHWKQDLLKTIADRSHDAPLEIPYVALHQADYRPAKAAGAFRHDLQMFILATDLTTGKGGYHVLTPFQLTDGQYVLVDRGWIPYDRKDSRDGFAKPTGIMEIQGILRVPTEPSWILPRNDPDKGNWYSIDLNGMASADKLDKFLPYILELADDSKNDTFPVGGQTRLTLPNDHLSYAVTWYSFALILLIIYFVSSFHKNNED